MNWNFFLQWAVVALTIASLGGAVYTSIDYRLDGMRVDVRSNSTENSSIRAILNQRIDYVDSTIAAMEKSFDEFKKRISSELEYRRDRDISHTESLNTLSQRMASIEQRCKGYEAKSGGESGSAKKMNIPIISESAGRRVADGN